MKPKLDQDEWLAEVQRMFHGQSDEGETADEIADRLGRSTAQVRRILLRLAKEGRLIAGKRTSRSLLDGRLFHANVYRLKGKK